MSKDQTESQEGQEEQTASQDAAPAPKPKVEKVRISEEELTSLAAEVTAAQSEKERAVAEKAIKEYAAKLAAKEAQETTSKELEELREKASRIDELEKQLKELATQSTGRRTVIPDHANIQRENGKFKVPAKELEEAAYKFMKLPGHSLKT